MIKFGGMPPELREKLIQTGGAGALILRLKREKAGLFQKDVAERMGCSTSTVTGYEINRRRPSQASLARWMKALRVEGHLWTLIMNAYGYLTDVERAKMASTAAERLEQYAEEDA
jgi:transcriptional regulator with XRE-family HTH domain